jgi:5-methyltetrahydropteroyltriglutamate--homocysteine methyltransferase
MKVKRQPVDEKAFQAKVKAATKDVVAKQVEVGVDIIGDGEQGRPSFAGYISERLGGFEVAAAERQSPTAQPMNYPILVEEFPGFMAQYNAMYRTMWLPPEIPREGLLDNMPTERTVQTGPITYTGQEALQRDLDNLKEAMQGKQYEEAFVTAATPPGNVQEGRYNKDVYPTADDYLQAMADALHEEYKTIVDAGFVLQLDLGIPARNQVLPGDPHPSWEKLRAASERQVEFFNFALKGIPEDRVRYHLCWGSMNTPHTSDVPLREIVDLILKINAQAYSIEAANPRHEHEWMVWEDIKLPEGKILIPGIVSHQTNVVEHPELVAWRIKNYASVVGKENVIAGTDCGFSQGWNMMRVHPEIQWAKLSALAEGAALASKELF